MATLQEFFMVVSFFVVFVIRATCPVVELV